VLVFAFLQGTGIPCPGGIVLVAVAAYAATTQDLSIVTILTIATLSGIAGSLCGYWVANRLGYRLLLRYGRYVGLAERRMKVAKYVCTTYGGLAVLLGRVFAQWIVPLAGIVDMAWSRVLPNVVAGSIIWAVVFGLGGYVFGADFQLMRGPMGLIAAAVFVLLVIYLFIVVSRHMRQLEERAELAYPGPLS
jgi:membrane protein DedA with SNARE-associated domain